MMENTTTTHAVEEFLRSLRGQNYSALTIQAYSDDLRQFLVWVEGIRVDFDNPKRMGRVDVEGFMSFLAGQRLSGMLRVRKLAAIRKFFTFLEVNKVIATNPALTVIGARREEKEPNILYKEQYKALLYEAAEDTRDYAIIMTFLQTGIRLSELTHLKVEDVDFETGLRPSGRARGRRTARSPWLMTR